jgi:hypothetical protein
MKRLAIVLATLALVSVGTTRVAMAQEAAGAGRVEVGLTPGGGTFFTKGTSDSEASFRNCALGASVTFNVSRYVGIEAELGAGLGTRQTIDFNNVSFADLKSPNTLAYQGNIAVYPGGKDHPVVPYLTAGIGAMTMFARDELLPVAVTSDQTFMTENVGGGVKLFANRYWGLRGDYRLIVVNKKDDAEPFFGLNERRIGHRFAGSLIFTF